MPASGDSDALGGPQPPARENNPPTLTPTDPALWEKVLRQTAELFQAEHPLEDTQREAIRAVARRYRGWPLALDPVVIELVQAMVGTQFLARPDSATLWRDMAACVAASILDDPLSRDRLQALWVCLGDAAA